MAVNYAPLWHWVREREAIRLRKEKGAPRPWTDDEILHTYRFCNVRREDDLVTIWVRKHIREPFADHQHLWFMLCIARQINWPATLAALIAAPRAWPSDPAFDICELKYVLEARKANDEKVFTGAYVIHAPSTKGLSKQSHITEVVLGTHWSKRDYMAGRLAGKPTLQSIHQYLMRGEGWGPFMAYQAVVDMRFTRLLSDAPDVGSWAAAGPGTIRGLNRLYGRKLEYALSQEQALSEMRAIYRIVQQETGVAMDFSDVPNILCETDKYLRVKNGEGKPRALYVPGRGA